MDEYVIDTRLGRIKGRTATSCHGDKYYSFQGIPYAKAPVGKLRFKAPLPIEPWSGELDGTKEGPACPSKHLIYMWYTGKEDNCLNLNIYIKEMPMPDVPLKPVMVWIHGGGFMYGSNSTEIYSPDYLMSENVIQVCINYRLGVLGFLCLEDESLGVTGNAGLKDQIMALKWVKDNISSFGGDPNNVTIYGQSAGGASVHYLMLSPKSKGLFHKAIIQSGSVLCPWARGQRGAKHIKEYLAIEEANEMVILDILQKVTPAQLVTAQKKSPELLLAAQHRPFGPVVETPSEDAFLSEDPLKILKSGSYNKVPMIIGSTSNEGAFHKAVKFFAKLKTPFDCAMEIPFELGVLPKSREAENLMKKIYSFYDINEDSTEEKTSLLKSDNLFTHAIHRTLNYHLESNNEPIYYYKFSFNGRFNHTKKVATANYPRIYFIFQYLSNYTNISFIANVFARIAHGVGFQKIDGSSHADEIAYLFGSILSSEMKPDSLEEKTMKRMVKLWTNFAKYGNPTPKNKEDDIGIYWKPVEKQQRQVLNIADELTMETNPFKNENDFWDDVYKEYFKN